jgi:hypothetical protein
MQESNPTVDTPESTISGGKKSAAELVQKDKDKEIIII